MVDSSQPKGLLVELVWEFAFEQNLRNILRDDEENVEEY